MTPRRELLASKRASVIEWKEAAFWNIRKTHDKSRTSEEE